MATATTSALKVSVVAQIHNDILKEMERILVRDSANLSESAKKFQVRASALKCSGKTSAKQTEEKMKNALELLRSIDPKGSIVFEMKPPTPKRKPPKLSTFKLFIPQKLSLDRLALNITHTVANTTATQLNPDGRAIPLCLPNDCRWDSTTRRCTKLKRVTRDNLVVCDQAVEILQKISGPVCVIAVVGPCRTGKSYILTRLITSGGNEQRKTCFKLGHRMDPETMGIWMWDSPFLYKLKDGREVTIVLLDTEGIDAFNATDRGDNQIFTLSVLLSSLLIYNSLSVPKRDDLDNMHFVANLASSIASRGKRQLSKSELAQVSPGFLWLLRDVILEPTGPSGKPCHIRDFLIEKVLSPGDNEDFEDVSIQAKASKSILQFFSSFDAETIPPPSTNPNVMKNIEDPRFQKELSPHFLNQIDYVRRKIFDKCQPKRGFMQGSLVNGIQLAHMLRQYVEALNSPDGVPEVGSTWERVVQNTYATATAKAQEIYQTELEHVSLPVSFTSLMATHSDAQAKAITVFDEFTQVDNEREIYNSSLARMTSSLATYASDGKCSGGILLQFVKNNQAMSEAKCRELIKSLKKRHLTPILDNLSANTSFSDITKALEQIYNKFEESAVGPGKEKALQDFDLEIEEDRMRYETQLRLLKDYDDRTQKMMEETRKQQLISIQQQKEKDALEAQMQQAKLENVRKLAAMERKLEQTEERSREQIESTIQRYQKQVNDLEQAKANAQTIIDSQKEAMSQQTAAELLRRQRERNLQQEHNKMQNKLHELEKEIARHRNTQPIVYYVKETRTCAIQ